MTGRTNIKGISGSNPPIVDGLPATQVKYGTTPHDDRTLHNSLTFTGNFFTDDILIVTMYVCQGLNSQSPGSGWQDLSIDTSNNYEILERQAAAKLDNNVIGQSIKLRMLQNVTDLTINVTLNRHYGYQDSIYWLVGVLAIGV